MKIDIENIFIQIPSFIFAKDLNSRYLGCNANFALSTGLSNPAEVVGIDDFDMPWKDTHAEFYRHGDQEVIHDMPKINCIETQRRSNGDIITIQINKMPLLNQKQEIIGVIGSYMEYIPNEYRGDFDECKINIPLSILEGDILYELALGNSAMKIADRFCLTMYQFYLNVERLKTKLQCKTIGELINKAISIDFIKCRIFGLADKNNENKSYHLTKREADIARLTMLHKSAKEIAAILQLSNRTVENYLGTIKEKMGVHSKKALIQKLMESDFR